MIEDCLAHLYMRWLSKEYFKRYTSFIHILLRYMGNQQGQKILNELNPMIFLQFIILSFSFKGFFGPKQLWGLITCFCPKLLLLQSLLLKLFYKFPTFPSTYFIIMYRWTGWSNNMKLLQKISTINVIITCSWLAILIHTERTFF